MTSCCPALLRLSVHGKGRCTPREPDAQQLTALSGLQRLSQLQLEGFSTACTAQLPALTQLKSLKLTCMLVGAYNASAVAALDHVALHDLTVLQQLTRLEVHMIVSRGSAFLQLTGKVRVPLLVIQGIHIIQIQLRCSCNYSAHDVVLLPTPQPQLHCIEQECSQQLQLQCMHADCASTHPNSREEAAAAFVVPALLQDTPAVLSDSVWGQLKERCLRCSCHQQGDNGDGDSTGSETVTEMDLLNGRVMRIVAQSLCTACMLTLCLPPLSAWFGMLCILLGDSACFDRRACCKSQAHGSCMPSVVCLCTVLLFRKLQSTGHSVVETGVLVTEI